MGNFNLKNFIPRSWIRELSKIEENAEEINRWAEEEKMSRYKEIPIEPQEGWEITEAMTNFGRKIIFKNGTASRDGLNVELTDGERIVSVSERRKTDPAIYNPENLRTESEGDDSWHMELDRAVGKGKITQADGRALMCISPDAVEYLRVNRSLNDHNHSRFESIQEAVRSLAISKEEAEQNICKTNEEWRHEKLVAQDQISETMDEERYDYLRLGPDALMTKEEWDLVFNTIKFEEQESTVLEVGPGYKTVIQELSETFVKKNADYGNSFEKTLDKRGLTPAIIRMEEKMERMEKLWDDELGNQVDDESIIDSAMDLANYAIMTAMWLKKQIETNEVFIYADNMRYDAPVKSKYDTALNVIRDLNKETDDLMGSK